MKIKLDRTAYAPTRAHDTDAGLDIRTPIYFTLEPNSSYTVNTGVHVQLPPNTAGIIVSKSGLNVNHDITSTGLIDENYTGEIRVKLFNHGTKPHTFMRGDKITQLVVVPVLYESVEVVDELDQTERGDAGFGSTGR